MELDVQGDSAEPLRSIQRATRFALPYWASVVVVNRGDSELLAVFDRERHARTEFPELGPRTRNAGDEGNELIAELERLRAAGWDYLLVPSAAFRWLDRVGEFKRYLEHEYRVVLEEDTCRIFRLEKPDPIITEMAPDGLAIPPPELIGLVHGTVNPQHFFESGAKTAHWITEMLEENGRRIEGIEGILDFGCGCGRVLRHWRAVTRGRLHGTDYNPYLIAWCRANLTFADFNLNGPESSLPYEDNLFDFAYAMSVFTHLREPLQLLWMSELVRILKPGGHLLLTLHGRTYLSQLDPDEATRFESGKLVVRDPGLSGSDFCAAFHPYRFVADTLGHGLQMLDYANAPSRHAHQDAVLFRKP